ncbi:glycoside hydrolase family 88 protein [Mucilaginibacter daejeonensis]|uniref:glycoside hydrolase family 88/105 protein n=1 Tax=Mucilaginibacter daejeonensis TaxID=398049 RepID=UPI001D170EE5|nr:glycoside hydrolase family 88 protein [Mucilaginibacter daejeonensis]UEG52868.1 glycoside hydrolase family 88 protein [Mucilaginibacter daejeonensis]
MRKILLGLFLLAGLQLVHAQDAALPYSQRMARTAMKVWADTSKPHWTYEQGVVWKGVQDVWLQTADRTYFNYIKARVDAHIADDGTIKGYKMADYNIDNVLSGRSVLMLYKVLGTAKYLTAVRTLREQLRQQPRVPEGGFWHKKRYPNQMWLDGLYMGEPFYAEYANTFHEDTAFNDIANQFILMERSSRDAKTGLLYHAWDQSKQERWADKTTGRSPHFWGRAMGWYGMALVDVLDQMPLDHPKRPALLAILGRYATAVAKFQDKPTGLWYQVLDRATGKGNYLEASASCMFVYALAKGVRQHYLPVYFREVAQKGYNGIIKKFISVDADGQTNLNGTVSVAGLGGQPYRDGSYEYYLSEKVVTNDAKGVGAFIQAAVEIERIPDLSKANNKNVLLDSYFNDERKKDVTGTLVPYHYKWEQWDNNGVSLFGQVFKNYGFNIGTLYKAPTTADLKPASVYVIIDADIPKENPNAKYVEPAHVTAVSDWVKQGGVLLVLHNDTGNAEFNHFNTLMNKFGMPFKLNSINHVEGSKFEQGAVMIPPGNAVFKTAKKIYIKEISTFDLKAPAKPVLEHKGEVVVAMAKYGKGTVIAVGDPWFYNEYLDGRKLPPDFDNYKAANDLVDWITQQIGAKK